MGFSLIFALAALCYTPNGADNSWSVRTVYLEQLECQKYFAECMKEHNYSQERLLACIARREEKK